MTPIQMIRFFLILRNSQSATNSRQPMKAKQQEGLQIFHIISYILKSIFFRIDIKIQTNKEMSHTGNQTQTLGE